MEKIGLPALVTRLFQEAQDVARAEIKLAKNRALAKVRAVRAAAILFVVALLFALAGLVGLMVGLVLALARITGPALAGVIVLVATLVIAGILGFVGAKLLSGQKAEEAK